VPPHTDNSKKRVLAHCHYNNGKLVDVETQWVSAPGAHTPTKPKSLAERKKT